MANTIKLGYSNSSGESPDTLAGGELATNTSNRKIWVGNGSSNTLVFNHADYSSSSHNHSGVYATAGHGHSVTDGQFSQNNFTNTDHTKLNGIATSATNTSAPHYTSAIGTGDGKLTTKNFTALLKTKLDGIAASAQVNRAISDSVSTVNASTSASLTAVKSAYDRTWPNTQLSTAQVRGKISASGNSQYNATTGVITSTNSTYTLAGLGGITAAYAEGLISDVIDSAPAALNTLNELAAALGDDSNYASTITTALAGKATSGHTHSVTAGQFSQQNFTTTLKNKLDGIAASAQVNTAHITNNNQLTNGAGYITGVTNISGNAATSGTSGSAARISNYDNRTIEPNDFGAGSLNFGFTSFDNDNGSPWADFIHLRGYTDASGGNDNLLVFSKSAKRMRMFQQSYGSGTAYSSYVEFYSTGWKPSLADIGFTGASNANYITNNNQLTNGAGYITSYTNTWRSISDSVSTVSNSVSASQTAVKSAYDRSWPNTQLSLSDSVSSTSTTVAASSKAAKSAYDRTWPNTWRSISDSVSTVSNSVSASQTAVKSAYDRSWPNTWRSISDSVTQTSATISASKTAVKAAYDRTWPNTQLSTADVRGKISASGNSSYNSSTGVITSTDTNTQRAISDSVTQTSSTISASKTAVKAAYDRTWPNTQLSTADVRGKISASGNSSYNSSTGVITSTNTNTQLSTAQVRGKISASGNSQYNSTTGVITSSYTNTTYSVQDGQLSQINFTSADHTKLNGIATSATNTSAPTYTSAIATITATAGGLMANGDAVKFASIATGATATSAPHYTSAIGTGDGKLTTKNFTTALKSKLDGIAASATNTLSPYYTSAIAEGDHGRTQANFTDVLRTKLNGIATGAQVNTSHTTDTHRAISNSVTESSSTISASKTAVKAAYDRSWPNTQLSTAQVRGKISASGNSSYNSSTGVITSTDTNTQLSTASVRGMISASGNSSYNSSTGVITSTDTNTQLSLSNSVSSTSTTVAASSAAAKTAYDRSWPNTTYSEGDHGLTQANFTDVLRTKLNGIASSANNYSHPSGAGNNHIPSGGASGKFLKWSSSGVATWEYDGVGVFSISAGNGLTGGVVTTMGTFAVNYDRSWPNTTYSAGTNMSLSGTTFSSTDTNTHRSISNSVSSTSSTVGASSAAAKTAYDRSWPNTTYSAGTNMSLSGTTFSSTNTNTTTWNGFQNVSALSALP